MKPEDKLLYLCARTDIVSGGYAPLIRELLAGRIDWDYLYKKALTQNLAPLLYKTLSKIENAPGIIPATVYRALQESYYSLTGLNLIYLGDFTKVINALKEGGVNLLAFKGLILGEMAYQDIGLRKSSDIDILIHKEDAVSADKLLRKLGYTANYRIQGAQDIRYNRYRNSLLYLHQDKTAIPVHLYWHWINLVPADPSLMQTIDMPEVWSRAVKVTLPSITVSTFSLPHQLMYLSLHGLSHGFASLLLLCDINELIPRAPDSIGGIGAPPVTADVTGCASAGCSILRPALDWEALVRESRRFGLGKHLYYALFFCRELLDTPVPAQTLNALKPGKISYLEKRFIASVLSGTISPTEEFFMYLGMNETIPKKLSFLSNALFPGKGGARIDQAKGFARYQHN